MMKSKIGPVTAYADAVAAGYTGTREEFGRQQADFAKNAASVEQAKTDVNQAIESFGQTANVAKEDVIAEGDRQVQRIEDIAPDLSLDREQIASNTAGVQEAKATAEEAKTIAKGRATGYVFDTVSDMETWLASEENTQNLVLGDNLYIRATDVPDYWWDGIQAQPLETQKVDMQEYVKFTDYASGGKAGVIKLNGSSSFSGIEKNSDGELLVYPAPLSNIKEKSTRKAPVNPSMFDLASVQSTHQEMSNDYDPSTAVTPDGNVPYAYGDRQPVSYSAVKGYVDSQNDWKNTPISEIILEEDVTTISVSKINGEKFNLDEIVVLIKCHANDLLNPGCVLFSINGYSGYYEHIGTPYSLKSRSDSCAYIFHAYKMCESWMFEAAVSPTDTQYSSSKLINLRSFTDAHGTYYKDEAINQFNLSYGPDAASFKSGTEISIYGKPARKGATS